jgi:hypothetical protein
VAKKEYAAPWKMRMANRCAPRSVTNSQGMVEAQASIAPDTRNAVRPPRSTKSPLTGFNPTDTSVPVAMMRPIPLPDVSR